MGQPLKKNGSSMAKEFRYGLTELNMMVNGKTARYKDMACWCMVMEMLLKGNLKMTELMDTQSFKRAPV